MLQFFYGKRNGNENSFNDYLTGDEFLMKLILIKDKISLNIDKFMIFVIRLLFFKCYSD